ncbi:aspartyl protease family protein [Sphingomonas sp. CLY1604]|uniref:aspartyl protease family protein n=1 Tax=Sphingomonas sp. CLY1604 TaxID=3457786 RepID=UPI003FD8343E
MMTPTMAAVLLVAQALQSAAAPMGTDAKGRPTIAVAIDGKPPVEAIVDTGAERTILLSGLARDLGLPAVGEQVAVSGIAGGESASRYNVKSLSSALFDLKDVDLIALSSIGVTKAQAIVGVDLFRTRKLVIDRAQRQVRVEPSGPGAPGSVAVGGTAAAEGLIVPLLVNGVPMQALIDSGAEGCVAGPDVLKALGWDANDYRLSPYGGVSGAAAGGASAQLGTMDSIAIGPRAFRGVPVVFLGQPAAGGGTGKPTMIVGLDLLNRLASYALDFPRAELQLPAQATADAPR